ncbi:unnamed protein product [Parajaminaea phylloscopi]
MADHFARAAGFSGGDETEASSVAPLPQSNRFDATMDTETQFTGIVVAPPPQQQHQQRNSLRLPVKNDENLARSGTMPQVAKPARIPPSRVPLAPASRTQSPAGSRPSSSLSQADGRKASTRSPFAAPHRNGAYTNGADNGRVQGGDDGDDDGDDDDDDSSEELAPRHNVTLANETTLASGDASEWERHIKESKSKAGVSLNQMQQRIDSLLQERDDLKIEVDILRRNYNPDDQAAELIRLRQENIRITNHRITLSDLLTAQKKTIKDLQRQAKQMSERGGSSDREARRRLEGMGEQVRLLDQQRDEEANARRRAEEEAKQLRLEVERSQADHQDLAAGKEDLDQEVYRLERQLDEAEEKREQYEQRQREDEEKLEDLERECSEWQERCRDHEARVIELEEHIESKGGEARAEDTERLERELQRAQQELQDVRGQLEAGASEAAVFRSEVEAQRAADEDRYNALRDELAAKENEVLQLDAENEALLASRNALEEEVRITMAEHDDVMRQLADKEQEIVECNREIAHQAEVVRQLEEEQEVSIADAQEADQIRAQMEEELDAQRDHYEMKVDQFKQRLATAAGDLADVSERLRASEEDTEELRDKLDRFRSTLKERNEELEAERSHAARLDEKCAEVLADLQDEERKNDALTDEWERKLSQAEDNLRRIVEEKEDAIQAAEDDLAHAQRSLRDRNSDLEALQKALEARESESDKLGRSSATDRHSLKLEIDRLRRDLSRCEADLRLAREDVERREEQVREKTAQMNQMYSENCDLSAKLATETQTRLGLDERMAGLKASLRQSEAALADARSRADLLEKERQDDDNSIERTESGLKTQLVERNALLALVSQHMFKILSTSAGDEAVASRKRDTDPKPATDFGAFHGLLVSRVHKLSEIQTHFERRAGRIESRFADHISNLKRQQDSRFKQLDRLEGSLKTASDKQSAWRSRVVAKQGELEAAKGTVTELQSQISSLKTRNSLASPGDNAKLTALTSRANVAEKRLAQAQQAASAAEERLREAKEKHAEEERKWLARIRDLETQRKAVGGGGGVSGQTTGPSSSSPSSLVDRAEAAEKRLGEASAKYSSAETKWQARIHELEARVRAAEEKVKRERQGAKERVAEQQEQRRKLERDVQDAQRRLKTVEGLQDDLEKVS